MENRMRSLHIQLYQEYDGEIVKNFCWWERYEKKMADFANHRRFTLRCLAEDLVPVSIRLKQNIRTPKGLQIIKKAERALLNERVRLINNTLIMLKSQRDTCMNELERSINEEWMAKCKEFIEVGRENHHLKTLGRQKISFISFYLRNKREKASAQIYMASIMITIATLPGIITTTTYK